MQSMMYVIGLFATFCIIYVLEFNRLKDKKITNAWKNYFLRYFYIYFSMDILLSNFLNFSYGGV